MSRDRLIAGTMFALGLAFLAGFALIQSSAHSSAQAVEDTGGPYLVINVEGTTAGEIVIDLRDDVAPQHVEQIIALAEEGAYDGIVFHRVIEGFMAQTGDVQHGRRDGNLARVGTGQSERNNLPAEFSSLPFERGVVGMARSQNPNSANSQFFIMFAPAPHLNGQYTVVGQVIEGMDVVDAIKRGDQRANGSVEDPDWMASVTVRR